MVASNQKFSKQVALRCTFCSQDYGFILIFIAVAGTAAWHQINQLREKRQREATLRACKSLCPFEHKNYIACRRLFHTVLFV